MNNKLILITGGSSGIGKAAATELHQLGAKIIIQARGIEKLKSDHVKELEFCKAEIIKEMTIDAELQLDKYRESCREQLQVLSVCIEIGACKSKRTQ